MEQDDWHSGATVGMFLNGSAIEGMDAVGQPITDDDFVLYFNAATEPVEVVLPGEEYAPAWDVVIDTAADEPAEEPLAAGASVQLDARSTLVLIEHRQAPAKPNVSAAASVAVIAEQVATEESAQSPQDPEPAD